MRGQLFTTHDVALLLQMDPSTVTKWMGKGLLKGFTTPGGHRRIQEQDLVTFLRAHGMPIPTELGGTGAAEAGCQHPRLSTSADAKLASCGGCGAQFRLTKVRAK